MRFFLAFLGLAAALVAEPPKELSDKQKLEVSRFQAGLTSLQLEARTAIEKLRAKHEEEMKSAVESWNQQITQGFKGFEAKLDALRKETGTPPECKEIDGNQKFVCPADGKAVAKK